jgi:sortase A
MRKPIVSILAFVVCASFTAPAFAYNYDFGSGPSVGAIFGGATGTDEPVAQDPMSENIRRNKDAALLPPPYFYGSGDIPTEPSSLYHDNTPQGAGSGYGGAAGSYNDNSGNAAIGSNVSVTLPAAPGLPASTSVSASRETTPKYYADGSIGSLYIAGTGKTVKVFEGEDLSNLRKGAGHFVSASAWDGNVALCGHNRGSTGYFSFVKDMRIGDKVTYTTPYGARVYEVISNEQIGEYDRSKLSWSADNILTLITCVIGIPELRWAATLKEAA